jgi:hypothetical protein
VPPTATSASASTFDRGTRPLEHVDVRPEPPVLAILGNRRRRRELDDVHRPRALAPEPPHGLPAVIAIDGRARLVVAPEIVDPRGRHAPRSQRRRPPFTRA